MRNAKLTKIININHCEKQICFIDRYIYINYYKLEINLYFFEFNVHI